MYITVSRKSNNFIKRFSKYMSLFLPGIKSIPRGNTPLSKIFKDAIFLGHAYFLVCLSGTKNEVSLLIYKKKGDDFIPDKQIELQVIEMKKQLSIKEIEKIKEQEDFVDSNKLFYFLLSKKKGNYGVYLEDNSKCKYSFKYMNQEVGFCFNVITVKKIK